MITQVLTHLSVKPEMEQTFVIFTESNHWLFKAVFREGFNHCYVIKWDGYQFILIDQNRTGLTIKTMEEYRGLIINKPNDLFTYLKQDKSVSNVISVNKVHIGQLYNKSRANFIVSLMRPNSCVEVVKSVLGMNTIRYLTPYSLYNKLIRLK